MWVLRSRPSDVGRRRASQVRRRLSEELRVARASAGLTQRQLARLVGVSQALVSAIERGRVEASLHVACLLAAGTGHELSLKLYPQAGVALRDSGQLGIAQAIVASAHASWHPRLEEPILPGDRRAADLLLVGPSEVLHIEIERGLVDLQAQLRNGMLKRDALAEGFQQPVRLVVVLPDRRSTRSALRSLMSLLERTLPLRSAQIRRSITTGSALNGDGIMLWKHR